MFVASAVCFVWDTKPDFPSYIWMEIGGVFDFFKLWSFRLYLGASSCIYFLAHDVFILMYLFSCDREHRG